MNDEKEKGNITQRLVKEFGMKPIEVAVEIGCAERTVTRWLTKKHDTKVYKDRLEELLERKKKGRK